MPLALLARLALLALLDRLARLQPLRRFADDPLSFQNLRRWFLFGQEPARAADFVLEELRSQIAQQFEQLGSRIQQPAFLVQCPNQSGQLEEPFPQSLAIELFTFVTHLALKSCSFEDPRSGCCGYSACPTRSGRLYPQVLDRASGGLRIIP